MDLSCNSRPLCRCSPSRLTLQQRQPDQIELIQMPLPC